MKRLTDLDDLAHTLHANAKAKGFYEPYDNMDEKDYVVFYLKQLAMVHSEVTEVLEAIRKDKGSDLVVEELADILIRVLDFWAFLNHTGYTKKRLSDALNDKIEINRDATICMGLSHDCRGSPISTKPKSTQGYLHGIRRCSH